MLTLEPSLNTIDFWVACSMYVCWRADTRLLRIAFYQWYRSVWVAFFWGGLMDAINHRLWLFVFVHSTSTRLHIINAHHVRLKVPDNHRLPRRQMPWPMLPPNRSAASPSAILQRKKCCLTLDLSRLNSHRHRQRFVNDSSSAFLKKKQIQNQKVYKCRRKGSICMYARIMVGRGV